MEMKRCDWCGKPIPKYMVINGVTTKRVKTVCGRSCAKQKFKRKGIFKNKKEYTRWCKSVMKEKSVCKFCGKVMPKYATRLGIPFTPLRQVEVCSRICVQLVQTKKRRDLKIPIWETRSKEKSRCKCCKTEIPRYGGSGYYLKREYCSQECNELYNKDTPTSRERNMLIKTLGTSKLPQDVKISYAIAQLGGRRLNYIKKSKIKGIIDDVKKGKTWKAYTTKCLRGGGQRLHT